MLAFGKTNSEIADNFMKHMQKLLSNEEGKRSMENKNKKIKMVKGAFIDNDKVYPGEVVETDKKTAALLVSNKKAVYLEESKAEIITGRAEE